MVYDCVDVFTRQQVIKATYIQPLIGRLFEEESVDPPHFPSALAIQAGVYKKTRSAADDTIHAVLFLLVGLVPFSYFLERLLFGSANVYRQIGGFTLLFVLMATAVGTFHPAFRISLTPVTILLAFL